MASAAVAKVDEVLPFLEWSADVFRPLGVFESKEIDAESVLRLTALFVAVVLAWGFTATWAALEMPDFLKKFGGTYFFVSNFACLYTAARGTALFYAFVDAPYEVQYNGEIPANATPAEAAAYERLLEHCGYTNELFLAYIITETLLVLTYYKEYGRWDALLHHGVYMVGSVVNHYYFSYQLVFTVLIQGEWSTPLLTWRMVLKEYHMASAAVDVAFAVTFFIVRVCLFGYGVMHMTNMVYFEGAAPHPAMPADMQTFIYIALLAMYALNSYWFTIIVRKSLEAAAQAAVDKSKVE